MEIDVSVLDVRIVYTGMYSSAISPVAMICTSCSR